MKSNIVNSFRDKKVLLIGDVIIDIYNHCNTAGQALYANVPEVEETKSSISFGGNGLVASNILELGGNLTFLSVIGDDDDARYYNAFVHPKLKKIFLVDKTRKTTVKRRWYAGKRALLQVNKVDNHNISPALEKKIIKQINLHAKNADVIVVMDPQHGLMTKSFIKHLKKISHKFNKPMYVDAQISHKKSNHHLYAGVDCMFLNEKETKAIYPKFNVKNPKQSLLAIIKKLKLKSVVVKLGSRGSVAIFDGQYIKSAPHKVKVIDTCGAGDAYLAAFSLGDRDNPIESLRIANIWGALSTTIHGTIPPKRRELNKSLKKYKR